MKIRVHSMMVATAMLAAVVIPRVGAQSHEDIAVQCSRFWRIAEQRVVEKPVEMEVSKRTKTVERPRASCTPRNPRLGARRHCVRPARPVVTRVTTRSTRQPPRPAVDVEQSARSRDQEKSFGLRLLGQLNVIDLVWRDRGTERKDSIKGRL